MTRALLLFCKSGQRAPVFKNLVVGYLASVDGVVIIGLLFRPFYRDMRGITASTAF